MRVWLYRKDAAFRELFRPNVEVRFLEDGGTFSNDEDMLFVHEGDACPEGISQACCRKIEFEQKKLRQCLWQPMVKNYDAWWLKYQLQRTDPFDTVVAGSSYPLFGLDMQQLPSWRNLSLASQDFYYATVVYNFKQPLPDERPSISMLPECGCYFRQFAPFGSSLRKILPPESVSRERNAPLARSFLSNSPSSA